VHPNPAANIRQGALALSTKSKRMIFHLHNPQVIQFINSLPRGYRSLFVEAALVTYMQTDASTTLVNHLQHRKNDAERNTATSRHKNVQNVLHKLKGDFD